MVLNTEKEIRAHLEECSHRPYPTVHMEYEMCACDDCGRSCRFTPTFNNNYLQKYQSIHTEFVYNLNPSHPINQTWLAGMQPVDIFNLAREHVVIPNIIPNLSQQFESWNICRIGIPPGIHPVIHNVPVWVYPHQTANITTINRTKS